jgi:hypothetical protein
MNFEERKQKTEDDRKTANARVTREYRLPVKPPAATPDVSKIRAILGQMSNRLTHMDCALGDAMACTDAAQDLLLARARGDLDKIRNEVVQISRILGV